MSQPWHDQFITVGDLGEFAEQAERHRLASVPPLTVDFRAEMPDERTLAIRDLAWQALDLECTSLSLRLDDEMPMRFHVLAVSELERVFSKGTIGRNLYRDVFVTSGRLPHLLFHDILHETAHGISFLSVTARRVIKDGEPKLFIARQRTGLMTAHFGHHNRHRFLNEVATDILAHRAALMSRDELQPACLTPYELDQACRQWAYLGPMVLVAGLCNRLEGAFGETPPVHALLRDYVTGTSDFLTALRHKEPRAARLIAKANPTTTMARKVAERLGYREELKVLNELKGD
jgi:hypothetical protein